MAIPTDLDRIARCEAFVEPSFRLGEGAHAIGAHFSLAAIRLGPVGASPGYGLAHMPEGTLLYWLQAFRFDRHCPARRVPAGQQVDWFPVQQRLPQVVPVVH